MKTKSTFVNKVKDHIKEHGVDLAFMTALAALNVGVYLGYKKGKKD